MPKPIATALALTALLVGCGGWGSGEPWNLIVVSIDTLRADHLGCYGHETIRTPNIDRFAARSLRFERCFSAVPITLPSHTTMLTGLYPPRHSVRDNGTFTVPENIPTVATVLVENGWRTAGVIGSYPLTSRFGLARGFEIWDEDLGNEYSRVITLFFDERKADRVSKRAVEVLDSLQGGPFFLFVHYFDPHHPWDPPAAYASQYRDLLYDGEIAFVDSWLGHLLEDIERRGLFENTVIIITADHGEGLGDHEEFTHSMLLYNETTRVPLLLHYPGVEPGVATHPVSLVDIAPTVSELLDVPFQHPVDGRSLIAPPDDNRLIYMETLAGRLQHGWNDSRASVVDGTKYILGHQPQLFDLRKDPDELDNLANSQPEGVATEDGQLRRFIESNRGRYSLEDRFTVADAEVAAQLRALGYLPAEAGDRDWSEIAPLVEGLDPRFKVAAIEVVSQIRALLNNGELLLAHEVLARALAADPEDAELIKLMLLRHILARDFDRAVRVADRYASLETPSEPTSILMAEAYLGHGDHGRALEAIEAHGTSVRSLQYLLTRANIHNAMGDREQAVALLEGYLAEEPCDRTALKALVKLDLDAGARERMGDGWERMLRCDPGDPLALTNLGNLSLEAGEVETARQRFEAALSSDPNHLHARYGLAVALHTSGDDQRAAIQLRQVLASVPIGSELGVRASDLLELVEGS